MTNQLSLLLNQLGVDWILVLLMALSLASVTVIVERWWFFRRQRVPVALIHAELLTRLSQAPDSIEAWLEPYSGMEARVVVAGVRERHRGAAAVAELMAARAMLEAMKYEKRLNFLASLGSNAPFIGLLGTVIGIMGAFGDLRTQVDHAGQASRTSLIMGSISGALVATAVGLLVAIPAVIAYNQLRTRLKQLQANTDSLTAIVLAHLKTTTPAAVQLPVPGQGN